MTPVQLEHYFLFLSVVVTVVYSATYLLERNRITYNLEQFENGKEMQYKEHLISKSNGWKITENKWTDDKYFTKENSKVKVGKVGKKSIIDIYKEFKEEKEA